MAYLVDYLGRFEIAFEPHASGEAKFTPQGAPGLAGYTQGASWRIGNENGFDEIAIMEAEQVLSGPIARFIDAGEGKGVEGSVGVKPGAEGAA
jgi:hypothetical protein